MPVPRAGTREGWPAGYPQGFYLAFVLDPDGNSVAAAFPGGRTSARHEDGGDG